jgi:site-specific recombinase XerC
MKLSDAFTDFLNATHRAPTTRIKYQSRLKPFLALHGKEEIASITPAHLFSHFDDLEASGLAAASLSVHRAALVALFNHAITNGWIESNPAQRLKRYDQRPPVIHLPAVASVQAMAQVCREWSANGDSQQVRDAALVYLAIVSGKRRGEIQGIRLKDANAGLAHPVGVGVYAIATTGKTGATAVICNEEGGEMVRRWLLVRPALDVPFLWLTVRPGPQYGKAIGARVMESARQRVCDAAGVALVTYQQMRRLKATQVGRLFGLHIAAEVLGHSTGTAVVRDFYYNPDTELGYKAIVETAL